MHFRILTDILEVLSDSLGDTDLTDRHTQRLHQFHSIVVCAVCRSEARHGNTDDSLAIQCEFIESLHRDEQCQCRVQTAADTYHRLLCIDMIEALGKTSHLDIQNLLTGRVHVLVLRDKRMRINLACQHKVARTHRLRALLRRV